MTSLIVDSRPLRIPAFRRLWTASAVTAVGGSFSLIAVPTQLFTLTGSSATVGFSAAVSACALIVSALWCGALADVLDRRRLLLAGNAGLGLAYLGLWIQAATGLRSVPVLIALVALQGVSFGATMTTMGAAVPRVVPADLLVAASSLSSLTRYTGSVIGPVLAGLLIPVTGLGTLYLFDGIALAVVLWAVARLPSMPPLVQPSTPSGRAIGWRNVGPDLMTGFRYLAGRRVLVAIIAVDLSAMVFAMPSALFPELAQRTYGAAAGGGTQLGLLYAAYPAGVLLAGLLSGTFSRANRHGALLASAAMAWGGCVIGLAVSRTLPLALIALFAGGAVNFVLSTFRNAISQAHTDDVLRGRIQGALTVVLMGGPQLANVAHGLAGAAIGARLAIGIGGAFTVVSVALVVRAMPDLWRYRADRDTAGSPSPSLMSASPVSPSLTARGRR
jgi:MFS family permease